MKPPWRRQAKPPPLTSPDDRMTLTEHLRELRTRIIRSLLAVVLGIIVIMAFYDQVLDFLLRPYVDLCERQARPGFCDGNDLISLGPLDGLHDPAVDRRPTAASSRPAGDPLADLAVHRAGAARQGEEVRDPVRVQLGAAVPARRRSIAYWTLEQGARVPDRVGRRRTCRPTFPVSKYISLVGLMVAAFGIGFEFPVLLVFLQLVGVLTPQTLLKGWRYAIMAIFVIAAVITPQRRPVQHAGARRADDDLLPDLDPHRVRLPAAQARRTQRRRRDTIGHVRPDRAELIAHYGFPLDEFQLQGARRARRRAARCSSPRRPAAARRSSPSTRSRPRCRPGGGRSTPRRSRRCRTRSSTTSSRATAPTASAC